MSLKVRPEIELTFTEALALAGVAYSFGFQREEPRKSWSPAELKEAARFAIVNLVKDKLANG